jgi:hypothetical protein
MREQEGTEREEVVTGLTPRDRDFQPRGVGTFSRMDRMFEPRINTARAMAATKVGRNAIPSRRISNPSY